jgi:hypothetical protein
MEIAARTMHSIPYIKFIHVQPTAYIYSMQNPTAAAAHRGLVYVVEQHFG